MKRYLPHIARILMGLIFLVFGGMYFVTPPPNMNSVPQPAVDFATALMNTHYMFPLIKGVEVAVGILLLTNLFVPLALVAIAPNIVNICLFHAFLEPKGLPVAAVILVLEIYMAFSYRDSYRGLFAMRAKPHGR